MYIYYVYIQFLFHLLNLHMSKKSSTFAAVLRLKGQQNTTQ